MLQYKEINLNDLDALSALYTETFNAPPWNDGWTTETAGKRLHQMLCTEDSFGLCAYWEGELCGLILGCREQYYDGIIFQIKEFCTKNSLRGKGIGTEILKEFELRLKQQGMKEIILLTSKGEETEGFYHKRGMQSYNSMVVMGKPLP